MKLKERLIDVSNPSTWLRSILKFFLLNKWKKILLKFERKGLTFWSCFDVILHEERRNTRWFLWVLSIYWFYPIYHIPAYLSLSVQWTAVWTCRAQDLTGQANKQPHTKEKSMISLRNAVLWLNSYCNSKTASLKNLHLDSTWEADHTFNKRPACAVLQVAYLPLDCKLNQEVIETIHCLFLG